MSGPRLAVLAAVGLALAACEGNGGWGAADGTERGACYGNQTCNAGLVCLSDRCVRLPGADCEPVAEALASLELGNYAPKDQRATRVATLTAICRAQNLSKDDGACILEAKTKDELAYCPKPVIVPPMSEDDRKATTGLPANCVEYLRVLDRYASCPKLGADVSRQLRQSIDAMRRNWQLQITPNARMPKGVNDACVQGMSAIKKRDGDDGLSLSSVARCYSPRRLLGQIVGKYRIVEEIAEGGMGMVYRAEHTVLGSPAAVKVLLPQYSVDPPVVDRFFTEAKATSAIRHVGIVEVFDFGMLPGGQAYIAMELLRGESLGEHLARRPKLLPAMAVNIAAQMLGALDAAHVIGVIHRDLKPDNVFLTPDPGAPGGVRIKILDFGIAKLVTDSLGSRNKTRAGTILGTPAYMAPEQCRGGGEIDHRADLYAVGCILFEMLSGRQPFLAEGGGEVMAMHIYEPAPRLRDHAPELPLELDNLMAKFLTKAVADRPPSAAWALAAIERVPLAPLPDSQMFALPAGRPHFAATATGPHRPGTAGSPTMAMGAVSLPPHRMMSVEDGHLPRWVPILLFAVALVIAIVLVIVIGRSGDDLKPKPVPTPVQPRPEITPIGPGSG